MESIKGIFIIVILIFLGYFSQGQDAPDAIVNEEIDSIVILHESPRNFKLLAASVVRFATNASVYLKWEKQDVYDYRVAFKFSDSSEWSEIQSLDNQIVLDNLSLDTDFTWRVITSSNHSGIGVFSTHMPKEPIAISEKLYGNLSKWFSDTNQSISMDEFLDTLNVHKYEKLSFIQAYGYGGESFRKSNIEEPLDAFFPLKINGREVHNAFYLTGCGCKVITQGNIEVTPREAIEEFRIIPRSSQFIAYAPGDKTYVDRFESGAAKFISLRQDEPAGGMSFQMSNLQEAGTPTGVTTQSSELRFFLACLRGGGYSSNLPARCSCERPLYIKFQYTTKLHVEAEKKGCIWSKGAATQAEDLAFLSVLNERTGNLTALAAGQFMLGRSCNSGWNPQWWIQLLNVVNPVVQVFIQNEDNNTTNDLPTVAQINQFITALQGLIGTPFVNQSGNCESLQQERTLVAEDRTLFLTPNNPLRIGLYSAYYVRTRGYGCYRAEAGIASDYFLMGVVESPFTEDPECCADKFASYVVGSLSTPENGNVNVQAVHTTSNRLSQVGSRLSPFGTWNNHPETPLGGVDLLGREFNRMTGPSCLPTIELNGNLSGSVIASDPAEEIQIEIFPTITKSEFSVRVQNKSADFLKISILNIHGQLVKELNKGEIAQGDNVFQYTLSDLKSGTYVCRFTFKNKTIARLFVVQ